MALTDILTFEGKEMENSFARGDVGVLVDVQSARLNEFNIPEVTGGATYPIFGGSHIIQTEGE
jgi:hypothetical protein